MKETIRKTMKTEWFLTKLMFQTDSEIYITGNMCWTVDTLIRIIAFIVGLIMFLSYNPMIGMIYIATYILFKNI